MSSDEMAEPESPALAPPLDEPQAPSWRKSLAGRASMLLTLAALLAAAYFLFSGIRTISFWAGDIAPGWTYHSATLYGEGSLRVILAVVLVVAAVALLFTNEAKIVITDHNSDESKVSKLRRSLAVHIKFVLVIVALLAAVFFLFQGIREISTVAWVSSREALPGWTYHSATFYGVAALGMALALVLVIAVFPLTSAARSLDESKAPWFRRSVDVRFSIAVPLVPLASAALLTAAYFLFVGIRDVSLVARLYSDKAAPGWTYHSATDYGVAALGMAFALILVAVALELIAAHRRSGGKGALPWFLW